MSVLCLSSLDVCLSDLYISSDTASLLQADFGLIIGWLEYSYIYLYEMFHKAEVLKNDHNFFRPVSQLKTSVIVWYLLNPEPPSQSVGHLTPSQAKSIWGLTDEELEKHYQETERGELKSCAGWFLDNKTIRRLHSAAARD